MSRPAGEAATFWDDHYRVPRDAGAHRPNPILAGLAADLPTGSALDLGCGPGGDAVWLAQRGWRVTAVDIAASAIERLAARAIELGLTDRLDAQRHDLADTFPAGEFDLVSAQYFQTPFELPRARVLRTAAHSLRPGGRLLVVDHGSIAPWSWNQDPDTHFATPQDVAGELDLDPAGWRVERADRPRRVATGPAGEQAEVVDNVLVVRRVGDATGSTPV